MKKVTETELFGESNVLLLDSHKRKIDELKESLTMISNQEIDNSCLIRGMVDYFYRQKDLLPELSEDVKNAKGYRILAKLVNMAKQGKSVEEIVKETGIDPTIVVEALVKLLS